MQDSKDLAGKTVLVALESNEGLGFVGVPEDGPFFCKAVAVDQVGLWVENKSFVTVELRDSKGRYVPKGRQKPQRHVVNLLLPWHAVRTVVTFEDGDAAAIAKGVLGSKTKDAGAIGFVT